MKVDIHCGTWLICMYRKGPLFLVHFAACVSAAHGVRLVRPVLGCAHLLWSWAQSVASVSTRYRNPMIRKPFKALGQRSTPWNNDEQLNLNPLFCGHLQYGWHQNRSLLQQLLQEVMQQTGSFPPLRPSLFQPLHQPRHGSPTIEPWDAKWFFSNPETRRKNLWWSKSAKKPELWSSRRTRCRHCSRLLSLGPKLTPKTVAKNAPVTRWSAGTARQKPPSAWQFGAKHCITSDTKSMPENSLTRLKWTQIHHITRSQKGAVQTEEKWGQTALRHHSQCTKSDGCANILDPRYWAGSKDRTAGSGDWATVWAARPVMRRLTRSKDPSDFYFIVTKTYGNIFIWIHSRQSTCDHWTVFLLFRSLIFRWR